MAAPYLMVGHSLGGLCARHYAVRFPYEVAALLLLDPAHEDYNAYMPQELNGSLDPSFGSAGKVTTEFFGTYDKANAVAIQGDGRIVAAGFATEDFDFSQSDFVLSHFVLARYLSGRRGE